MAISKNKKSKTKVKPIPLSNTLNDFVASVRAFAEHFSDLNGTKSCTTTIMHIAKNNKGRR